MKGEEDLKESFQGSWTNDRKESPKRGNHSSGEGGALSGLRSHVVLILTLWTVTVFGLLGWALWTTRQGTENLARKMARAYFNKDYVSRSWVASHGGVYVPTNERTPPNPYLRHVPERDITTPSGRRLTLMNAAYVLRQMHQEYSDRFGVKAHLTGLKHFRPETAPDEWEKAALVAFKGGLKEKMEFTEIEGEPYLRLMSPLTAKKNCLKCHGIQGYKEGDVRGGASISLPMKPFRETEHNQTWVQVISHGAIFLLGISVIFVGMRRLRQREEERNIAVAALHKARDDLEDRVQERTSELVTANRELKRQISERMRAETALKESEERYRQLAESSLVGVFVHEKGIVRYVNQRLAQILDHSPQEIIGKHVLDFVQAQDLERVKQLGIEGIRGEPPTPHSEFRAKTRTGHVRWVEVYAARIHYQGSSAVIGNVIDISERKRVERQLQQSEEKYRLVAENAQEGIIIVNVQDATTAFVNPRILEMSGFSEEEFRSRRIPEFVHPEDLEIMTRVHQKRLAGDFSPQLYECRLLRKDGNYNFVEIESVMTTWEDRAVSLAFVRDLTERKQAEEALRQSEEKYRLLVDNSLEGIVMVDLADATISFVNPIVSEISGYSQEELLTGRFSDFIHPADVPKLAKVYEERLKGDLSSKTYECRLVTKDGEERWIHVRSAVTMWQNQQVSLAFLWDITDRMKAEEALRHSEELYRGLVETTDTGYVVFDGMGRVLDANAEYVRLTGHRNLGEILGRSVVEWTAEHDRERNAAQVKKCLEMGSVRNLEIDYVDRSGKFTPVEINATVIEGKDGTKIVGLCRDITDRKETEQHIRASLKEKEVLLREIHHRVKNNLQIMSSLLRLQARHVKDEATRILFQEAEQRVLSMALVHERLYRSKSLAEIDFGRFVEELLGFLRTSYNTRQKNIRVRKTIHRKEFPLDTAIPLGFIITELVTNCFRHAFPENVGGEVHVSLNPLAEGEFRLTVSDNGIGIPEQVDTLSPISLGMKLIRVFVDQLGGSLDISREKGAEFRITFRVNKNRTSGPLGQGS